MIAGQTSPRCFLSHPATTELYTLSLHDALPILGYSTSHLSGLAPRQARQCHLGEVRTPRPRYGEDRNSTRLNSSHLGISYAVFCLKTKKTTIFHRKRHAPGTNHAIYIASGRAEL